jgi:UPF0042 nucleotide-binding protein
MRRFSETRRPHPLARYGDVLTGISQERKVTAELRDRADWVQDTSRLDVHQLRRMVIDEWVRGDPQVHRGMRVRVQSFGFKYGIPIDSDLVFDARFLPNPYFVDELRPLSGEDAAVSDHVLSRPEARKFLDDLQVLLEGLIPRYEREGKAYLTISVGCTGGRHRSVAVSRALAGRLDLEPPAVVLHRDIDRTQEP